MVQIKPEELTTESFAPYGRVLEVPDHACTKQGAGWVCWSPVDFMLPDAPVGVGIVRCGQAPQITALERHVSREELLWTTTRDVVMAVDLPVRLGDALARPNIETTRVFRIKAGQAVIIARGAWHSPAFAVQGEAEYFFLVEQKADLVDQDAQPWIAFAGGETLEIG